MIACALVTWQKKIPDKIRLVVRVYHFAKFSANVSLSMASAPNTMTTNLLTTADWACSECRPTFVLYRCSVRFAHSANRPIRQSSSAAIRCVRRCAIASVVSQRCRFHPLKWRSRWAHETSDCSDCDASDCDWDANDHCCSNGGYRMYRFVDLREKNNMEKSSQIEIIRMRCNIELTCVGLIGGVGNWMTRSFQWTKQCAENSTIKYDAGQNK